MDYLDLMRSLHVRNDSKIVLMVLDGLGGLPLEPGGPTELEAARTPNMDSLARQSICGLTVPVAPGVTPGSGPAHLALFGYDPIKYQIGRGVLEVLGIDFPLQPNDIAARGNFCTVDTKGIIVDRRAGRISSERASELCQLLQGIRVPGLEVFVLPVREHRFALVLRGEGLDEHLADTDPQVVGRPPLALRATAPEAERTAQLLNDWISQARQLLTPHSPANMFLLRGFSRDPGLPKIEEIYGLRAAAIATYPMYRGVAKLVGMTPIATGPRPADEIESLEKHWPEFDFFFIHFKYTDSRGEDGDFAAKVKVIEEVDQVIPRVVALGPDVLIVTGDHSTPAALKAHSWHPVPFMLHSPYCRPDDVCAFSERACAHGALGVLPAIQVMPLAMANAQRLEKFGA